MVKRYGYATKLSNLRETAGAQCAERPVPGVPDERRVSDGNGHRG